MRAAGLVCLGAGAGLIRGDLRDVRGSDVAAGPAGSSSPCAAPGRAPCRCWPATTPGCWPRRAFAGTGLVCGGTDPGRRNLTNPLIRALDGGTGLPRLDTSRLRATWLADCADCSGWPRSCTRPGSAAPSGWVTCVAGLEPAGEAEAVRLLGAARR